MHIARSKSFVAAAVIGLALTSVASVALAGDCEEDQETVVGKTVAAAVAGKVNPVIPGAGKQMINLETCDVAGGSVTTEFKMNVIGSDGLYWVVGHAKIAGTTVQSMALTSMSPNLAAASAKAGVKLASN